MFAILALRVWWFRLTLPSSVHAESCCSLPTSFLKAVLLRPGPMTKDCSTTCRRLYIIDGKRCVKVKKSEAEALRQRRRDKAAARQAKHIAKRAARCGALTKAKPKARARKSPASSGSQGCWSSSAASAGPGYVYIASPEDNPWAGKIDEADSIEVISDGEPDEIESSATSSPPSINKKKHGAKNNARQWPPPLPPPPPKRCRMQLEPNDNELQ